jgi:Ca2+/H+ antiporter
MSARYDVERASTQDERAPLLASETSREDASSQPEEEDSTEEPQKAASRTWHYVWRAILLVCAILVIAAFVKAWISADDVEVSTSQDHLAIPETL